MSQPPWTLASGLDTWPDVTPLTGLAPAQLRTLAWSGADGVPSDAALASLVDAKLLITLENGRLGVPWQVRAEIGARVEDSPPLASARLGQISDADLAALAARLGCSAAADRPALLTGVFAAITTPQMLADLVQRLPGETVIELLLLLDLGGRPIDPAVVGRPELRPHLARLAAVGLAFVERGAWFIPMDVGLALGQWRAAYVAARLSTSVEQCTLGAIDSTPGVDPTPALDASETIAPLRALLSGGPEIHTALMHLMVVPKTVDALLTAAAISRGVAARPLAAKLFALTLGRQGSIESDRIELTDATAGLVARWFAHILQTAVASWARLPIGQPLARAGATAITVEAARWVSATRWFERVEYGVQFAATPPIASCAMLLSDAALTRAGGLTDALLSTMQACGLARQDAKSFVISADLQGALASMDKERRR
ncbi:MAG: hypothetical protein ACI9U2_002742 [Bradymonadia bacterium]